MICCTLLYVHSITEVILMGKRELVALLNLSSWCLVMVEWLFLAVPWGCLRFVIVVFPDHTHLLFLIKHSVRIRKWINIMLLLTSEALVEDEPVKQPNSYAYPSAAGIDTYHH